MTTRQQRYDERRGQILDAARKRADAEGWASVTTRHLADAIGYSQPVLYGHFPSGKSEIMRAVAEEGFVDITRRCRTALGRKNGHRAVEAVATAYLDFCRAHPAVYEAMFQQDIGTTFASATTPSDIRAGFEVLAAAIGDEVLGERTEVFWGALHGIGQLERAGRMRTEDRGARIAALATLFGASAQ